MKKIKTVTFELKEEDVTDAIRFMLINSGEINEGDRVSARYNVHDISDDRFGGGPNYSLTDVSVRVERKD